MAVGRREGPHLPAEARQLGSAHSYGESLKRSADQNNEICLKMKRF